MLIYSPTFLIADGTAALRLDIRKHLQYVEKEGLEQF
jgi:hypothetical protein